MSAFEAPEITNEKEAVAALTAPEDTIVKSEGIHSHHHHVHPDHIQFPPDLAIPTPNEESLSTIRLGTPAPRRSKMIDDNNDSPLLDPEMHHHGITSHHVHFTPETVMRSPPPSHLKPEANTPAARLYYEKLKEEKEHEHEDKSSVGTSVRFAEGTADRNRDDQSISQLRLGTPLPPKSSISNVSPNAQTGESDQSTLETLISSVPIPPHSPQGTSH